MKISILSCVDLGDVMCLCACVRAFDCRWASGLIGVCGYFRQGCKYSSLSFPVSSPSVVLKLSPEL